MSKATTEKQREEQRARVRKHYQANKQYYVDKSAKARQVLIEWVKRLKEESPCADCGVSYPHYVMDFDHRGEQEKRGNISRMIFSCSRKRIEEEIAKCDIVCANCHRARTYSRIGECSPTSKMLD